MAVFIEMKFDDVKGLVVGTVTTPGTVALSQPNICPTVTSEYELSDRGPIQYIVPEVEPEKATHPKKK